MLLEFIAGFPVIEDAVEWAKKYKYQRTLLKKNRNEAIYYLMKSADVVKLAGDLKLKTPLTQIGRVMNRRADKLENNPTVRAGKITISPVWWFSGEKLKERGLDESPDVEHVQDVIF
jgi:hypothetical protein